MILPSLYAAIQILYSDEGTVAEDSMPCSIQGSELHFASLQDVIEAQITNIKFIVKQIPELIEDRFIKGPAAAKPANASGESNAPSTSADALRATLFPLFSAQSIVPNLSSSTAQPETTAPHSSSTNSANVANVASSDLDYMPLKSKQLIIGNKKGIDTLSQQFA